MTIDTDSPTKLNKKTKTKKQNNNRVNILSLILIVLGPLYTGQRRECNTLNYEITTKEEARSKWNPPLHRLGMGRVFNQLNLCSPTGN